MQSLVLQATMNIPVLIKPQLFILGELNNCVKDSNLPKDAAELLGSRLQEKHLLSAETSFSWHRYREEEFVPLFATESQLVYCRDISGLISTFGVAALITALLIGDCSSIHQRDV